MSKTEHKNPSEFRVKMPSTPEATSQDLSPNDPPSPPPNPTYSVEWKGLPTPPLGRLDDYPYDGQPVFLRKEPDTAIPAVWRKSRSFDMGVYRWQDDAFWSGYNSGGQKIGFSPKEWRPYEEPPLLGKRHD